MNTRNITSVIYILPGGNGRNDGHFYTWLAKELRKQGYGVAVCSQNLISPALRAERLVQKYPLTPNSIIIGHSFGGLAAMKWVELAKQKIAGLVLIDTSIKKVFEKPQEQLLKTIESAAKRRHIEKRRLQYFRSWNWNIDFSRVRKCIASGVILGEKTTRERFPDWEKGQIQYARMLRVPLFWKRGVQSHFRANKEPEVLKAVKILMKKYAK